MTTVPTRAEYHARLATIRENAVAALAYLNSFPATDETIGDRQVRLPLAGIARECERAINFDGVAPA